MQNAMEQAIQPANNFHVLKARLSRRAPLGGIAKRMFDICFAVFAIMLTFPLMVVIAGLIKLFSKGPVFFAHKRVGYGGEMFPCLKFRSMRVDAEARLEEILQQDPEARAEFEVYHKLKNDPRIIPYIGTMLRKTSLDELPQFFNVLMGHMSVVGPRPVTREEFDLYGASGSDYLSARPGITGLWQVSGRSGTAFDLRIRLDSAYVNSWSALNDFRIILKTFRVLRKGAC